MEEIHSLLKVKIIAQIPGSAPERMRQELVGLEIRLPSEGFLKEHPPSKYEVVLKSNLYGYKVRKIDLVSSLIQQFGKKKIAEYWGTQNGLYIGLHPDCCRIIGPHHPYFAEEEVWEYARVVAGYKGEHDVNLLNEALRPKRIRATRCTPINKSAPPGIYAIQKTY